MLLSHLKSWSSSVHTILLTIILLGCITRPLGQDQPQTKRECRGEHMHKSNDKLQMNFGCLRTLELQDELPDFIAKQKGQSRD